jgi:predicted PurR-regulated permease PerM
MTDTSGKGHWDIGRVLVAAVAILAIVAAGWLVMSLTHFLLLVFAAVVLAAVFDALTGRIVRHTPVRSRGIALALAVFVIFAAIFAAFFLFGSQFASELDTIRAAIPGALAQVDALLTQIGLGQSLGEIVSSGTQDLSKLASSLSGYAMAVTSGVTDFVLVLVGAIFIAADPRVYRRGLLLLLPDRAVPTADRFLDEASTGLRGWMFGQMISSVVVAVLTGTGLMLLGVPASGGLGVIAGLLDPIPMVGPVIAGIPAVLLALTVSPMTALWTVVLFLVIQQIQGNFLQPMIQKHAVDVPPAVLLFAVFGFGILFGTLGVLLSAPLTIVAYVLVQRAYVKDILNKDIKVAAQEG